MHTNWISKGQYNISNRFNVTDLVPFIADEPDLRTNPFQEGGNDVIMGQLVDKDKEIMSKSADEYNEDMGKPAEEDVLTIPNGPMTRSRTKRLNEAIGGWLKTAWKQEDSLDRGLINQDTLITIQATIPSR